VANFHDLRTFLTASGLLAAVLAVWVRFWVDRGRDHSNSGMLGVLWSSIAIIDVLAAIGVAVFQNVPNESEGKVGNEAIGVFMAGLFMAAIAVGLTMFQTLAKCYGYVQAKEAKRRGVDFENGLSVDPGEDKRWQRLVLVLYPISCAVLLIGGCIWFSYDDFSTCSGGMWFLILWVAPLILLPVPLKTVKRWMSAKSQSSAEPARQIDQKTEGKPED
jgi:hypothetical protein